jgi:predicted PurR-regulated permease PerM
MQSTASDTEQNAQQVPRLIAITPRTLWQAAAIVVGIFLVLVVIFRASAILLLIFTAIILAEGLRPITRSLSRIGIPRGLSIGLIYLLGLAGLFGLGWLLATPLVNQVNAFVQAAPAYINEIQHLIQQISTILGNNPALANALQSVENQAGQFLGQLLVGIISLPLNIATVLFSIVVVLTMAFFWLTSMDNVSPFVLNLFAESDRPKVLMALAELSNRLGGFVRGVTFNMFVIGVLSGVGMWILGVPYSLLLGIFAGLTEIIPFLGPYFGGGAAVIVAATSSGGLKALEVAALYVIIQELEGNILVPIVMHRAVQLNPFGVIVAVLLGGELFGLAGSVLAVPLAVVVSVIITYIIVPSVRRQSNVPAPPEEAVMLIPLPEAIEKPDSIAAP